MVQDGKMKNLFAGDGIAIREAVMAPGHGRADYLLYVDKRVVGVIEAKPVGTPLSGVEWQSAMYAAGLPEAHRKRADLRDDRLPFVFEASGTETHFTNGFDPDPRSRQIFNFPTPSTLARIIREAGTNPEHPTWRAKVRVLPRLYEAPLRPAQITAVHGTERSLAEQQFDRSLIQMATGAGKTYTAVTLAYRLLTYGGFSKILFLVDRNNLADQTLAEFQNYTAPGDGRRFSEVYAVDKLTGAGMLASSNVVISTIQRVFKVLNGHDVAGRQLPPPAGLELVVDEHLEGAVLVVERVGTHGVVLLCVSSSASRWCVSVVRYLSDPATGPRWCGWVPVAAAAGSCPSPRGSRAPRARTAAGAP